MTASDGIQSILITGATSGIGRVTALRLARTGHQVFATGRSERDLATLEAQAAGTRLSAFRLDVTDPRSIASARELVLAQTDGGGLDALVNNAGFGVVGPVELQSDQEVRAQFETNVFGLLAVTRAFLPEMRERGRGRLVNVSSVGGRVTFPFFGPYNATKFAVEALSDALRQELSAFGVRVVLVEPGVVRTEFADRATTGLERFAAPDSPYAWVLARADRLRARAEAGAVGPDLVARAVLRALFARRPPARIVTPRRGLALVAMRALLPERWLDAIFGSAFGLSRRARLAFDEQRARELPA